MLNRMRALKLLLECTGDEIWSLEHCRQRRVPEPWIDELSDCFESGFADDSQTIYVGHDPVNQYHGVRDIDLAMNLGKALGIDAAEIRERSLTRKACVRAIQEAVEEG